MKGGKNVSLWRNFSCSVVRGIVDCSIDTTLATSAVKFQKYNLLTHLNGCEKLSGIFVNLFAWCCWCCWCWDVESLVNSFIIVICLQKTHSNEIPINNGKEDNYHNKYITRQKTTEYFEYYWYLNTKDLMRAIYVNFLRSMVI